jgi:hypothetical protein
MGAEELLLAFHDEPEMVRDMMRTCTDLWLAVYEGIAAKVRVDHIHIWEDMSGRQGSLISMPMLDDFMMPERDSTISSRPTPRGPTSGTSSSICRPSCLADGAQFG